MPLTVTKADILARAGEHLRLVQAGQSLETEDEATLSRVYDDALSMLRRENIAHWSADAVPNWAALSVSRIVAGLVPTAYYSDVSQQQVYYALRDDAKDELQRMKPAMKRSDRIIRADMY